MIPAAVAPGRGWTYDSLAEASGLKVRRLKSYVHEGNEPSMSAALSVALVLGERAVNAVLAVIGYGGAAPLDGQDAFNPLAATANAMGHLAVIARAAADGRIDHIEQPLCQEAADLLIAEVLPLSSAGKAV